MNADALARELDLCLDDVPICLACLSFVAFAVESGDELEIRRWTRKMTPDLWEEGLALPVKQAVERARRGGVPGASDAVADLERGGSHSAIARAIVLRLAEELSALAQANRGRI